VTKGTVLLSQRKQKGEMKKEKQRKKGTLLVQDVQRDRRPNSQEIRVFGIAL